MAIRQQSPLFQRLVDLGTGRLPANATLDQQRYVILDTIGKGGMGAVYLAQDTQSARLVAIKEMSQARLKDAGELQRARQHFQQEAEMLQRLHHANLPQVYGWFQENDRSYLVMEYIQGQSLFEILKQKGGAPLPVDDVFNYAVQLCGVLTYLHQRIPPIIFHDLKPSNVMLGNDGRLFLIDFGIARFFRQDKHHPDTEVFITPGYSPPEQYSGQTTPRSDLFSLGATLHHCLTGQNPQSHTQTHLFHFLPADQLNPQVPGELSLLVQEMLSMQPQERPADASDVQHRLQQMRSSPVNPSALILGDGKTIYPSDVTVNLNAPTPTVSVSPRRSLMSWFSVVFIGLSMAGAGLFKRVVGGLRPGQGASVGLILGIFWGWVMSAFVPVVAPFKHFVDGLRPGQGRSVSQVLGIFWQQQVSQLIRLSRNQRVWKRSFTLSWLVTLVLILSGSIYLLRTVPDAPHVIGLTLIVFVLCTFGFALAGRRLTDVVPRSILILMIGAFLLAGMALQAEPDMDEFLHTSLQSLTLNLVGAFVLIAGGLICLLRPRQRLAWVEQIMLGLLALGCAILLYGFGPVALEQAIPPLSADFAQALNILLIGILLVLALLALFRMAKPLQKNRTRIALLLIATIFTLIQYTSGFQEWQSFLPSSAASAIMLHRLVILIFVCTLAPVVCAVLALYIRQPWINRIVFAVLALEEAMMLAYQGQQIQFAFFPGNAYPLSTSILEAQTFSQLVGPILVLVACLALFRLPRPPFFQALDHAALLVGSLICARLDAAFWQAQSVPLSNSMDQQALSQQFTILTGQLLANVTYLLLFALPLTVLVRAFCYFWRQFHPHARIDPWLKRLRGVIMLMERLLALVLVSIAFMLQGFAGTLQLVFTSGLSGLFTSNSPAYLNLCGLFLVLLLAIVGLVLLVRLFWRSQGLGRSERFALLVATLSCLVLIGQHPDFLQLPLLNSEVQLTGNILHWPGWLSRILFLVGLLIPLLLAIHWLRRSFFAQYREVLRSPFLIVMVCAILQFFWPPLLPVGMTIFVASVLLLIQIEKVE